MTVETNVAFPDASMDAWQAAAEKALKGADFEATLVSKSADGVTLHPLHERASDTRPLARTNGATAWTLVQKMDHIDPEAANAQAHEDLLNGATGLAMVFADAHSAHGYGLPLEAETFDIALRGIDLTAIHLRIEPGPRGKKTQQLFADYVKRAGYIASKLDVRFGLDAIGAVASCGTMRWPFEEIQGHMREQWQNRLNDGFHGPFFEADGRVFHDAGATEAQELAITLANGVSFLKTLAQLGDTERTAKAVGFTLSADADQFMTLAKMRAMRLLWAQACAAFEIAPEPCKLHAETSWRMLTASDPNTNLLRISTAIFAAGVGGADSVTVTPHIAACGLPDGFSRRMARNAQSILLEEGNLFRVVDPAAGSGAFETLTDALAEKAWGLFQEIEAAGGIDKALTGGLIHGWINRANEARRAALAAGDKHILGVNLHAFDGSEDANPLDVSPRPDLVITKGALTIDRLVSTRDEDLLGETS